MKPEAYKTFCCRYFHEGGWWALDIQARDWAEAEARVKKLGNLQLQGELMGTIHAWVPGAGWWVRLICWVRNWWKGGGL